MNEGRDVWSGGNLSEKGAQVNKSLRRGLDIHKGMELFPKKPKPSEADEDLAAIEKAQEYVDEERRLRRVGGPFASGETVEKAWNGGKVNPKEVGKYEGWTLSELRSAYNDLKKKGPHKKGSSDLGRLRELAFAIRAKTGWGGVKKEDEDLDDVLADEGVPDGEGPFGPDGVGKAGKFREELHPRRMGRFAPKGSTTVGAAPKEPGGRVIEHPKFADLDLAEEWANDTINDLKAGGWAQNGETEHHPGGGWSKIYGNKAGTEERVVRVHPGKTPNHQASVSITRVKFAAEPSEPPGEGAEGKAGKVNAKKVKALIDRFEREMNSEREKFDPTAFRARQDLREATLGHKLLPEIKRFVMAFGTEDDKEFFRDMVKPVPGGMPEEMLDGMDGVVSIARKILERVGKPEKSLDIDSGEEKSRPFGKDWLDGVVDSIERVARPFVGSLLDKVEFEEGAHPRDLAGKFAPKGSSAVGEKKPEGSGERFDAEKVRGVIDELEASVKAAKKKYDAAEDPVDALDDFVNATREHPAAAKLMRFINENGTESQINRHHERMQAEGIEPDEEAREIIEAARGILLASVLGGVMEASGGEPDPDNKDQVRAWAKARKAAEGTDPKEMAAALRNLMGAEGGEPDPDNKDQVEMWARARRALGAGSEAAEPEPKKYVDPLYDPNATIAQLNAEAVAERKRIREMRHWKLTPDQKFKISLAEKRLNEILRRVEEKRGVGKSLVDACISKAQSEMIMKESGWDKLPIPDKAKEALEGLIGTGAKPVTEYTGKILVEHGIAEEPPAFVRPKKLEVGDMVIPLDWRSVCLHGAKFDMPQVPKAARVKKIYMGPAKVSKNPYPFGRMPSDISKVETVTEDRMWGIDLEGDEVGKDDDTFPSTYPTRDTTMVLRMEALASPEGEVNPGIAAPR